ncbi:unnamed protein product [Pleuronectes platessa]|uniref:Uncharacterized protein n=1 Tax=Pleuronectes platessa TaxID=8262 RepID=A0A9N7TMV5_PLEPL|nr:unnamed protein product [Pleuronectes platessa]
MLRFLESPLVCKPEGETPSLTHPRLLLASTSMADSRQPEDGAPQWDPSRGQEPAGTHGANGYPSSAFRTCQAGGAHLATSSYSARENGFNGELTGAPAITAVGVSAQRERVLSASVFLIRASVGKDCARSDSRSCGSTEGRTGDPKAAIS